MEKGSEPGTGFSARRFHWLPAEVEAEAAVIPEIPMQPHSRSAVSDLQQVTMQFTEQPLKTVSSWQLTRSTQMEESTAIRSSISLRMTRVIPKNQSMRTIL